MANLRPARSHFYGCCLVGVPGYHVAGSFNVRPSCRHLRAMLWVCTQSFALVLHAVSCMAVLVSLYLSLVFFYGEGMVAFTALILVLGESWWFLCGISLVGFAFCMMCHAISINLRPHPLGGCRQCWVCGLRPVPFLMHASLHLRMLHCIVVISLSPGLPHSGCSLLENGSCARLDDTFW